MKRGLALVAIASSLAVAPIVSAPAQAGVYDNCISWREFKVMSRDNMHDLEKSLDAKGTVVSTQFHGASVLKRYRWCGLTSHDGFVQIQYDQNKRGQYMSNYVSMWDFRDPPGPMEHQPSDRVLSLTTP